MLDLLTVPSPEAPLHSGLRIATIGPTWPHRGGIALYTGQLVTALRQRHSVELFTFSRQYPQWLFPGNTAPDPSSERLEVSTTATLDGLNPITWWRAAHQILRLQPDLLVMQWWTAYWLPLFVMISRRARRAGVPVLTIAHQMIEPDSSFGEWFVSRRALGHSDGLLVMNEEELGMARRVFPTTPVRLASLPAFSHGGAPQKGRADARRRLGLDSTAHWLLAFGFVRRYKGLQVLLEALPHVSERIHLLIAGEFWEDERDYRHVIDRLGLTSRVVVHNRYVPNEQVGDYFAAADTVVLPYLAASQSAVGTTALSFGLPVIASDVGGLRELVLDGTTGMLVPPGRVRPLAAAIDTVASNGFAERCRRHLTESRPRLSWDHHVAVLEELAAELLSTRPA